MTDIAARAVRMAVDREVVAIDGSVVAVEASSLCVHSDTPGAVAIALAVRDALAASGVSIHRFTS